MKKNLKTFLLVIVLLFGCAPKPAVTHVSNLVYGVGYITFDIDAPVSIVSADNMQCESAEPFTHWVCPIEKISGQIKIRITDK